MSYVTHPSDPHPTDKNLPWYLIQVGRTSQGAYCTVLRVQGLERAIIKAKLISTEFKVRVKDSFTDYNYYYAAQQSPCCTPTAKIIEQFSDFLNTKLVK
jgi:hypothetical protein